MALVGCKTLGLGFSEQNWRITVICTDVKVMVSLWETRSFGVMLYGKPNKKDNLDHMGCVEFYVPYKGRPSR